MKTFQIDRMLAKSLLFVAAVNVIVSLIMLIPASPGEISAKASVMLQITTMVCVYAVLASAYGVSATRGAERVFCIGLCMMFFVMLNVEAQSEFLGIGIVSITAMAAAASLSVYIASTEPAMALTCVRDLIGFAFSRNFIPFAAALSVYIVARTNERVFSHVPASGLSWLLHQASLLSVMVLFLYAACPYLKRRTVN